MPAVDSKRAQGREWGVVMSTLHTFLFAVYPALTIVTANLGHYPINGVVVLRALAIVVAIIVAALWLLRILGWSLGARAAWLSVFLIALNLYYMMPVPPGFGRRVDGATASFAILYLLACGALASVVIRPWRNKRRDPIPLTIIAAVVLTMSTYAPILAMTSHERRWESAADALITPSFSPDGPSDPERDVYVIILDAFGRPDVIRDLYHVDMSAFVSSLEASGFYVPQRSRSNYAQTFLAISSMLNMEYLDGIAKALGPASRNRLPLKHIIERNAMMSLAKQARYTVVGIASDYTATEAFPLADVCFCPLPNPHEFDYNVLRMSPFVDLGREQWIAAGRRRSVLDSFEAIERASQLPGRKFVVAHLVTPHPPFVFDREGQPRTAPAGVPFIHGEWLTRRARALPEFAPEYIRGYAEQTEFVTRRLATLTERLLSQPGPAPAIMIVGDHGPALDLDLEDFTRTNMRERMSIFSAYHLPGNGDALYPEISPVNGARAVADRYFGVRVPFLPEQSAYSAFLRPYQFTPVPSEALEAARTD